MDSTTSASQNSSPGAGSSIPRVVLHLPRATVVQESDLSEDDSSEGEVELEDDYEEEPSEEDPEEYDDDEDGDFAAPKSKSRPKAKVRLKEQKPSLAFLPRPRSTSSDADYAAKSHKKNFLDRAATSRSTPDSDIWKRDAARKITSYNEAEVDYGWESDEDLGTPVEAIAGETDEIDQILAHERHEDHLHDLVDKPTENLRFHVKWKGYSHLHNTEEVYSFLKTYRGIKKVDNYINKTWAIDERFRKREGVSRDELEQYDIDKERLKALYDSYKIVERILDEKVEMREQEPVTLFFCKWTNLQYSDCTWEVFEDLIDAHDAISNFHARQRKTTLPNNSAKGARPPYVKIERSPTYLGGELLPFQLTGLNWMAYLWCTGQSGILADDMGMGKTIQTIAFLAWLLHSQSVYGPFLVVVPLSTITNWQKQFQHWAPEINVVCYMGSGPSRRVIQQVEFGPLKNLRFNVLLTTYEFILKDRQDLQQMKWQVLAVDEGHRLKNSEAILYDALQSLSTAFRLLITGTPLQNSVKELLALMHFVMPNKFQLAGDFELKDADPEKIQTLQDNLKELMLRRLKQDELKDLPTRSEQVLRVEMSAMQAQFYKNILTKNFPILSQGAKQISLMNVAIELRKACNHPYLFDGAEDWTKADADAFRALVINSGKMVLLDKLLAKLKAEGHRVLIFSQMTRLLDILSDYMAFRGYLFQRIDGTVPSEARNKAIEAFNAQDSPYFCFLLSTRAGGLGINLCTADTVIIFDSDYNPMNDEQGLARAHRIGQQKHVSVYRLVTKGSIEEDILQRARMKRLLEYTSEFDEDYTKSVMNTDMTGSNLGSTKTKSGDFSRDELNAILKFGAKDIYKTDDTKRDIALDQLDLDDVLRQADTIETDVSAQRATTSMGGQEFLSQFANIQDVKLDELDWEDIIPTEERIKLDEEESRALQEEENAAVSRRRAVARGPGTYHGMDEVEIPTERKGSNKRSGSQKALDLKERDIRMLIRAMQKWGDIRSRYDNIVREARLEAKNRVMIIQTCDDVISQAEQAVTDHRTHLKDLQDRGEPISSALRQKAILLNYKSVSGLNAETILARQVNLKALSDHFARIEDPSAYQIPYDSLKPTQNWTVEWERQDDDHLLIGVWRHGLGGWEQIAGDETLQLSEKIFLEEKAKQDGKTGVPGPVHLVRRADYLCGLIREYEDNRNAVIQQSSDGSKVSKNLTKSNKVTKRKRRETPEYTDSDASNYDSMDEAEVKELLRPVKAHLKRLKQGTDSLSREEKIAALKESVAGIGSRIDEIVITKEAEGEDGVKWRKHCWVFASFFWPREGVSYSKLMDIHHKLLSETAPLVSKKHFKKVKA